MSSLLKLEKKYQSYLINQYNVLLSLYNDIKSDSNISLETYDITKSILLRMKAFADTNNKIKKFLNKRYAPAAADFFVESILFYLKLALDKFNKKYEVHSEKQIRRKRGSIRPDISIWDNDEIIAIIECKTNLGWNRKRWEDDFLAREAKLHKDFPNAKAYLVIITSENWAGIPADNIKLGEQYYILSKVRPTRITNENFDSIIQTPIEDLFKKLI